MPADLPPLFRTTTHTARELLRTDLPRLQALFEANPGYFERVSGAPPGPDTAREEYDEAVPAHLPHGRRWWLAFEEPAGTLDGTASLVRDLGAPGVWHLALFFWADALHGRGAAAAMHGALQAWAAGQGAAWLRLGVVVGNARAEAFWPKLGYVELRRREVDAGRRRNTVRMMVKPLDGGSVEDYLGRMPRDRPDSALP